QERLDRILTAVLTLPLMYQGRSRSLSYPRDTQTPPLLAQVAPEPLDPSLNTDYLWRVTRRRRVAIKQLLMNSRLVVGVGNIYASEALFRARIRPQRQGGPPPAPPGGAAGGAGGGGPSAGIRPGASAPRRPR